MGVRFRRFRRTSGQQFLDRDARGGGHEDLEDGDGEGDFGVDAEGVVATNSERWGPASASESVFMGGN